MRMVDGMELVVDLSMGPVVPTKRHRFASWEYTREMQFKSVIKLSVFSVDGKVFVEFLVVFINWMSFFDFLLTCH